MIFHTIDVAIESGCFEKEDIYVSTDSEMYKGHLYKFPKLRIWSYESLVKSTS